MGGIRGIITTRTVFRNAPLIGCLFGPVFMLRCLVAAIGRKPTTFLSLLCCKPPCTPASDSRRS